jgi:ABC-type multidrug transport system ATPase subunit
MSLLSLEGVGKRFLEGPRERVILREVSMELEAGELVAVWGLRRSGRSTLLRIAAGIEAPNAGVVRFEGADLSEHAEEVLGGGIGYCQKAFRWAEGKSVLDHVVVSLLARGVSPAAAKASAREALARVGAEHCAKLRLLELDSAEAVRVALARTLALQPRLLVIDEPVKGVELLERDEILGLLRTLADEGVAVLASAGESTGLSGADRALALGDGELRGGVTAELAPVLPLRRPAARRASA